MCKSAVFPSSITRKNGTFIHTFCVILEYIYTHIFIQFIFPKKQKYNTIFNKLNKQIMLKFIV